MDSLLNIEIPKFDSQPSKNSFTVVKTEDAVSKLKLQSARASPVAMPIDLETASLLRELTVGNCVHSFSNDWKRAKLVFRHEEGLSYGLLCEKVNWPSLFNN